LIILRCSLFYCSLCRSVVIECRRIRFFLPRGNLFCNHMKPIAHIWELKTYHICLTLMLPWERTTISQADLILEFSIKTSRPKISLFVQLFRFQILHTTPIVSYQIVTDFHSYHTQIDLFLRRRFNPRLSSPTFQPIFRNRITAL
jgi:hypothetical protein